MTHGSQETQFDWQALEEGKRLLLAFVKIDRKGATQEWQDLPQEAVLRRSREYTAGVEAVARAFNAAALRWQGDGVILFLKDEGAELAPLRAMRAARELWKRIRCDLNLSVRIAVHAAWVHWNPDPGKIRDVALDHCGHLEQVTPENAISAMEDVYLVLPDSLRRELAPLGITKRDKLAAFVFPANAVTIRDPDAFEPGDDLQLWQAFRTYANCPEVRKLLYVGFRLTKKEPPNLEIRQVFIPPEVEPRPARSMHPAPSYEETADEEMFRETPWRRSGKLHLRSTPLPFRDIFARNQNIVVLGDPGSGKTTLLRWVAVVAAAGRIAIYREVGGYERLLPLPVSIGRLAEIRHRLGDTASMPDALALYFEDRHVGPVGNLTPFLRQRIASGECLFLLDGLDEVRAEQRDGVHRWLETFAASAPKNRFVVSCRIADYRPFDLDRGVEVILSPFTDDQVRRYLAAFHDTYRRWEDGVDDPVGAREETAKLLDALTGNPRLMALARNPLLLSAVALIHRAEGTLPRHRVQAYETIARTLCETWESARRLVMGPESRVIPFEEEAIPILGELAVRMQDEWPAGVAPEPYVLRTLADALGQKRGTPVDEAREAAREFLNRAGERAQVLLEPAPGEWGFFHLTFQEYFAAAGLHASDSFERVALKHVFNPRWQEVIRLGVGYMAFVQKRPGAAARFVERVFRHRAKGKRVWLTHDLRMHIPLAAMLAAEVRDALPGALRDEIAREFAAWTVEIPAPWRIDLPLNEIAGYYLNEISLTDYREDVARILIPALENDIWDCKRAACALGMLRANSAVQPLTPLLNDPIDPLPSTPEIAAQALARIRSNDVIEPLVALLRHEDPLRRFWAAKALAELRQEIGIGVLMEVISHHGSFSDKAPRTQTTPASSRSTRTASPSFGFALPSLASMLENEASLALAEIKTESVVEPLLKVLSGADNRAWPFAARALAAIEPHKALQVLLGNKGHPDPGVRGAVADSLGKLGLAEAVGPLLEFLSDRHPSVRGSAASALATLRAEAAIPRLLEVCADAREETYVRASVIGALGQLRATEALCPLIQLLEAERDPSLRRTVVRALGSLRAEQALPSLIRVLEADEDFLAQEFAARGLGSSGLEAAVEPLVAALRRDESAYLRKLVAYALGTLKSQVAVPHLLDALRGEKDAAARAGVISALGAVGAEDAIEPLREALKHPGEVDDDPMDVEDVEVNAFEALWRIAQATEARPRRRGYT